MVVWKQDWKKPVYGPKCPVFEWSAKSRDFTTWIPDTHTVLYSVVWYSDGYCILISLIGSHDKQVHARRLPVSNVEAEWALVTVEAVFEADVGAHVAMLTMPEVEGKDGATLTERVERHLAVLQHVLHLGVWRLKDNLVNTIPTKGHL